MSKNKIRRASFNPDAAEEDFTEVLTYDPPRGGAYSSPRNHFEVQVGEAICTDKPTAKYLLETFPDSFELEAPPKRGPGRPPKNGNDDSETDGKKAEPKENKAAKAAGSENKGA